MSARTFTVTLPGAPGRGDVHTQASLEDWGESTLPEPERMEQLLAALGALEAELGGQIGLYYYDTGAGYGFSWRGAQRFPMNSTFKVVLAGAVLAERAGPGLMDEIIPYGPNELVTYSPVTEQHAGEGMTRAALCRAALQHSDNTAANLLIRDLGGPAAVTAYARTLGDASFRLDRWETELNDNPPGDPRDTTTPRAMGQTLEKLLLGDALPTAQREQLVAWMRGNKTGEARIRAGAPTGWTVADKTGTGGYGTANDVGVLWPPAGSPVILVVFTNKGVYGAAGSSEAIAGATRLALAMRE